MKFQFALVKEKDKILKEDSEFCTRDIQTGVLGRILYKIYF